MTEEQRHHGAERDPECPPQLCSAACAATDESDAGEHNGLRQDLQRYRAAHCKKDCGKAAIGYSRTLHSSTRRFDPKRQRTQLSDAPLLAMSSVASSDGCSGCAAG